MVYYKSNFNAIFKLNTEVVTIEATVKLLGYIGKVKVIEETETNYEIEMLEGVFTGKRTSISKNSKNESIYFSVEGKKESLLQDWVNYLLSMFGHYKRCENLEGCLKISIIINKIENKFPALFSRTKYVFYRSYILYVQSFCHHRRFISNYIEHSDNLFECIALNRYYYSLI